MTESSGAAAATAAEPEMPEPPKEFVDAARLAPDHWLYSIDPAWQGEGPPPDWAVVGQWRSDLDGVIVEWEDNENYQPSPEALGWPEPADDVDAAIQLATTGYGPAEDVTSALAKAEVAVLVTASGEPVSASAPDGTAIVPVFTSPRYLHLAGRLGYEQVYVPALLARIPEGHSLCINSSAPVSMIMTAEGLAEIAATAAQAAEAAEVADAETPGGVGSGGQTPEVEWPTTVDAGEHATLRDALVAQADSASDDVSDGTSERESSDESDREPGVVDLPLPEPDAGGAR
ncbi:type VII secretion system-associated protein [Streptomyces sp. A5-4]|uniref:type VII secretion system-associated protein n=1 Tax=Streptomyces sp. A5-4 TaxID=3384771 RepID=UPI003DA8B6FB